MRVLWHSEQQSDVTHLITVLHNILKFFHDKDDMQTTHIQICILTHTEFMSKPVATNLS